MTGSKPDCLRLIIKPLKNRPEWLFLAASVAAFTTIVGWILIQRYLAFETFAWDLGVYNQALATTVLDHRFFYYTADLPAGTGGSLFAAHFSPLLILMIPFYYLSPTPEMALVIQAFGIGLGAIPAYLVGAHLLHSRNWGIVTSATYLVTPITLGTIWYDFHPEAFLPAAILFLLYFYLRGSVLGFLISCVAACAAIETASPFILLFLVTALLGTLWDASFKFKLVDRAQIRLAALGIVLSALWLVLSFAVVNHFNSTGGTYGPAYSFDYMVLGAQSLFGVYPTAILHPSRALIALHFDGLQKVGYFLFLFGAFAFIPLIGKLRYVLPVFAWVGLAVLSNNTSYYTFGDQYSAYVLGFLVVGFASGLESIPASWFKVHQLYSRVRKMFPRLRLAPGTPKMVRNVLVVSLVVGCIVGTNLYGSPLLPNPGLNYAVPHGIPTVTTHDKLLDSIIGLVPPSGSILTTIALFPEVSSRADAYVVPVSSYFRGNLTFNQVLDGYVNKSDYVLVDLTLDYWTGVILLDSANLTGFGIEAEAQGIVLYTRGWMGTPQIWSPVSFTVPGASLATVNDRVDSANGSKYGSSLDFGPGFGPGNITWSGAYLYNLTPGRYEVNYSLEVWHQSPGLQLILEVNGHKLDAVMTEFEESQSGHDYSFNIVPEIATPLNVTYVIASTSSQNPLQLNVTMLFLWNSPAVLDLSGWSFSSTMSVRLFSATVTQLNSIP